jgi:hypothetical protein
MMKTGLKSAKKPVSATFLAAVAMNNIRALSRQHKAIGQHRSRCLIATGKICWLSTGMIRLDPDSP